jgi:hypothetical protein
VFGQFGGVRQEEVVVFLIVKNCSFNSTPIEMALSGFVDFFQKGKVMKFTKFI